MANYDRLVLVPYLQDVCCVEMLCRKLEQEIMYAKAESEKLTCWANGKYEDPTAPNRKDYSDDGGELIGGIVGLVVFGGPGLLLLPFLPVLGCIGIALGVIMLWSSYSEQRERNARAENRYNEAVEAYRKSVSRKSQTAIA